jgi:non-heme chloroperoxidase
MYHAAMNGRRLLTTLVGAGAVAHGLAARKARQLQSLPDPVPYEDLCEEPEGEEQLVSRPDGTQIRVRSAGEGPTVVLAHGYGVTLLEWKLVWVRLRELGYRCVAFDQRGHGHSTIGTEGVSSAAMAGDYEAVLRELDLRDVVLVGHSLGGFLAIKAILDQPGAAERLRGFVAFASTAGDIMRGSLQNRLQLPAIRLGIMQAVARSSTYSWLFGASLCGEAPSPAALRLFNEIFAAQPHQQLAPIIEFIAKERYYERLGEIELPTVVICGQEDHTTPRWHSELMGERIFGARNVWVPGKGHLLNWEAPEALVEAVQSLMVSEE